MDIFHCLIFSPLLTLLVSTSTRVSNTKPGQKGDVVEYSEYYSVITDLVELSGIYKRRTDYENHIQYEKRGLDKNVQKDSECGCKCSSLTYSKKGKIQGNCANHDGTGEHWCYVGLSYANCSDLIPSIRFHNNPWSYEACLSPSSGSSPCPYDPGYSVLYLDHLGFWNIGHMFDGSVAFSSKSSDSIYPPENETWVQNTYGKNGKIKDQKDIFVSVIPCKMNEKLECVNNKTTGLDTNIILAISISLSVILVTAVILVTLYMVRKGKEEEDPEIEDNYYYGDDGNMDSIRDHRVVDTNDYYD